MVPEHPEHVGGEHDSNHHRESFGNRHHHDSDRQNPRMQEVGEHPAKVVQFCEDQREAVSVVDHDGVEQVGECDQASGFVPQSADRPGQPCQTEFERTFPCFLL